MAVLNPDLLAILACPACDERPPLELHGDYWSAASAVALPHPRRDTHLLVEEALPLEQVEREQEPPKKV
jgi:hypothetical protein